MPPTYWPPLTDALFRQFSTPPVVPYSWPTMAAMPYLLESLVTSTRPLHRHIPDGAAIDGAEQAVVHGRTAGDVQVPDGVPLPVKGALVRFAGAISDGRPRLIAQVDVIAQHRAEAGAVGHTGVHLLGQPRQLTAAGDLVHAVHCGRLADVARSLPGGLGRHGDGHARVPLSLTPVRSTVPLCLP